MMAKLSLLSLMVNSPTVAIALLQCVVGVVVLHDYMSVFIMRFDPDRAEFVYTDVVRLVCLRNAPETAFALLKLRAAAGEAAASVHKLLENVVDDNALGVWKGLSLSASALNLHEEIMRRVRDMDSGSDSDSDSGLDCNTNPDSDSSSDSDRDDAVAAGSSARLLWSVVKCGDAELGQLVRLSMPGSTVERVVQRVRVAVL
jgi:hypothetical protein